MVAIDLLGHGANNRIDYNELDLSVKAQKDFLLKTIDDIEGPILLLGNSLGGHLVIEVAPAVKKLVGLVIFGTPPFKKPINLEETFLPVEALQTFLTPNPDITSIEAAAHIVVANPEVAAVIANDFSTTNPLVRAALASDILGDRLADEWEIFTTLKVPKYIIKGDQDPSVNPMYLDKVVQACSNNCELITIENCGHYPSLERPMEFNEILLKIIDDII